MVRKKRHQDRVSGMTFIDFQFSIKFPFSDKKIFIVFSDSFNLNRQW